MLHFNGPALAAEALKRVQQADSPTMDAESSEHLRETAQTYATLALAAATLSVAWNSVPNPEAAAWETALGLKRAARSAA